MTFPITMRSVIGLASQRNHRRDAIEHPDVPTIPQGLLRTMYVADRQDMHCNGRIRERQRPIIGFYSVA